MRVPVVIEGLLVSLVLAACGNSSGSQHGAPPLSQGGEPASGGVSASAGTGASSGASGAGASSGGATGGKGGAANGGAGASGTGVSGGAGASAGTGTSGSAGVSGNGFGGAGGVASGGAGAGGVAGASGTGAAGGGAGSGGTGGTPSSAAGWLYTSGGKIYVSDGKGGGTPWMGRGVNMTDLYLCGYNNTLWMSGTDQVLENVISGLVSGWKANFVRISLSMNSFPTVTSWLTNASQYQTPMTNVINAIGTHPNLYALVTLRSDASMIGEDTGSNDPEATGLPSDASTTPSNGKYPTGTDATYVGLVDSFANAPFVLFGLTNEPGGSNTLSNATIGAAMNHAVGVIRAEEDRLGVPHHIVSVQGNGWSSDISFYAASPSPITHDNVVYEVHGYPPPKSSYTYPNIPVIIGEYGTLGTGSAAFYSDMEAKQLSNLAWDFDSYAGCAPDLLDTNQSATNLVPTAWGSVVQSYLLMHAP